MKTLAATFLASAALIAATPAFSQLVVQDHYWGGLAVHNDEEIPPRDVVGNGAIFDLTAMEFNMMSGDLNVIVHGNYFKYINPLTRTDDVLGTTLGDLFISADGLSWDEGGKATAYNYIGGASETSWEYAVKLGTYGAAGDDLSGAKTGSVHMIGDGDSLLLSDPGEYTTFRANQAVRLETQSDSMGMASWFIDPNEGFLSITIEGFGDMFAGQNINNMGFHWTMSCGNDVIEAAVPEPGTIGLLGVGGILGILLVRRRIRRSRK